MIEPQISAPLPLGTATPWGKIIAIHFRGGERYYHLLDAKNSASLMPASLVEAELRVLGRDHGPGDRRCPSCDAAPGEPCVSLPGSEKPGNRLSYFHGARRRGALA